MKVPILEIPEKVSELCTSYSPLFSRPQYNQFERYITSLFVSDEANVQSLAEGFRISQSYDSLHNFVSESPWDIDDVLEQTVRILKNLPDEERLTEEGILIIDDSLIEKYGKLMDLAGKLYDHSRQRYLDYAHCLVGLCWTDSRKLRYPLKFDVYRKKEDYSDEDILEFKTKIQMAQEMIDWAVKQGIPFKCVIFDSWYFCKELCDHLESLGKDWISMSKSDRKLKYKGRKYTCVTYSQELNPEELRTVQVKGKDYNVQSVQAVFECLKRNNTTCRLVVSYERTENGYNEPVYLVSNNKELRPEDLINAYKLRWSIETFFRDAKTELGFGDYQMRKEKGIKSHWCLVFTSAVILELIKWKTCKEEGIDKSKLSFGELKRRSFGQTLRMLIKKTIELNNANLNEEQILKILKI